MVVDCHEGVSLLAGAPCLWISPAAIFLGVPSPFFPGILLSRKPPETRENGRFLKRTMIENNGQGINPWNLSRSPTKRRAMLVQPGVLIRGSTAPKVVHLFV